MWVWFTLLAAAAQAGRNAFQKQLSRDVPVLGVTLARFLYAVPLAIGYLWWLYQREPTLAIPHFSWAFLSLCYWCFFSPDYSNFANG